MRIFLAAKMDETQKQLFQKTLQDRQEKLKEEVSGNYTRIENTHLTLAFLGELELEDVEDLKVILQNHPLPKTTGILQGYGSFAKSGILYTKIKLDSSYLKQVQRLRNELVFEGFVNAKGKFTPHITLVRQFQTKKETFAYPEVDPVEIELNGVSIMLSERINGVLTYREIG